MPNAEHYQFVLHISDTTLLCCYDVICYTIFTSKWVFAATVLWNNKNSEILRLEATASSASRDGFANTLLSEHPVRYQSSLGRDDTANANFFLVFVRERIKCYYGEFRTARPLEQVQRTVLSAMNIHGADWCGLAFGRYKDFATDCVKVRKRKTMKVGGLPKKMGLVRSRVCGLPNDWNNWTSLLILSLACFKALARCRKSWTSMYTYICD